MLKYIGTFIVAVLLTVLFYTLATPKGFYKFYDGDAIGDYLKFESRGHSIKNDTIYFNNKPIKILLSKHTRWNGDKFITVREIESNLEATYIKK